MKAFVEEICEHAGIIRVGPDTDQYGKPFDMAAAFTVEIDSAGNRVATIKALTAPMIPLTIAHARAAVDALSERGFKVRWFRVAGDRKLAREIQPNTAGRQPVLWWRPIHRTHAES